MAFTIEDGTGKADANAYVSTAFVDAWIAETGSNATWAAKSSTEKEQCIVQATRYIDSLFGPRFVSRKRTRTQALHWPRDAVYQDDGELWIQNNEVPIEVQRACAEYAIRAASAALISDPADSREATQVSTKVGPIATSTTYGRTTGGRFSTVVSGSAIPSYPAADMWLERLLKSSSSSELLRV
jgi:hypothetical protein